MYGVLKEAEHRSTFYIPYWNLPFAKNLVPRQRKFFADLAVINDCLDDLIAQAKNTRQTDDAEALQARDYSKVGSHLPLSQRKIHTHSQSNSSAVHVLSHSLHVLYLPLAAHCCS